MSIFPTKILLATDGSQEAALAARTAADIADKSDSELHVVLVGLSAARRALTNSTPRLEHCQHHRDEQGGRGNDRRKDQVAHHERGRFTSCEPPALLGRLANLRSQRDQNQRG